MNAVAAQALSIALGASLPSALADLARERDAALARLAEAERRAKEAQDLLAEFDGYVSLLDVPGFAKGEFLENLARLSAFVDDLMQRAEDDELYIEQLEDQIEDISAA